MCVCDAPGNSYEMFEENRLWYDYHSFENVLINVPFLSETILKIKEA